MIVHFAGTGVWDKLRMLPVLLGWLGWVWATVLGLAAQDPLETGFKDPPPEARPSVYFLVLNGYVNREWVRRELEEYRRIGIRGLTLFDMGARGDPAGLPPPGPEFLSPQSVADLAHIIKVAGELGMSVELSVSSSWDMGASWVTAADGSKALVEARIEVQGPQDYDGVLPMPEAPAAAPRDAQGRLLFYRDVAVLGLRDAERAAGFEFLFELDSSEPQVLDRVVFYNAENSATGHRYSRRFRVSVSECARGEGGFREVVSGSLEPHTKAQEFHFQRSPARFVRLEVIDGHGGERDRLALAEFEAWSASGENVVLGYRGWRAIGGQRDGAKLVKSVQGLTERGVWAAENINDGRKSGAAGSWASGPVPPMLIRDMSQIVVLDGHVRGGRLKWRVPEGRWTLIRYGVVNTGERLKVPSPNSDGLTTDHLDADVTRRYIREVIRRLAPAVGDFRKSALRELYLASYEVVGRIWTPGFLEEFRRRRGYDLKPFLPVLSGACIVDGETTDRVLFDFRKTLGEVLVEAYYRAASQEARRAGLGIHAEAGGPGPPIHQVPVDALAALGAIDSVRGEFWPFRPRSSIWVVKETACAAHIYGKRFVHMEAFTTTSHWQEAPQDLKASADRAFCEGMNRVVWHTSSHQPPEAGKPGWAYGAGTHLMPTVPWWEMGRAFLEYLARISFMMQQGEFVADVLYYYGDGGFNFVPPKHVDPSLGFGYDYDVTNAEVLQRLQVRDGKLLLPHGMSYEILVLPDRPDVDPQALEKIAALVAAGATVVGRKPVRASGYDPSGRRDATVRALAEKLWGPCDGRRVLEHRYGKGRIVWGRTLREVLIERGVGPDLQFVGGSKDAELDFIHRRTAEADIYFVRNGRKRAEFVEAVFRVKGKIPELWDAATGEIREAEEYELTDAGVRVPLQLEPEGSVLVVFRQPAASRVKRAQPAKPGPAPVEIAGGWTVEFPPGWGAPASIRLERLISWTEHPDPGVQYFSGVATYRVAFEVAAEWLRAASDPQLDLGALWGAAEVMLNDRPVGVAWKAPFRLPVRGVLKPGRNELVVKVANNWVNRLVGDAREGTRRYTRTNITVSGAPARRWAEVELKPSGLFGPVRLVASRWQ